MVKRNEAQDFAGPGDELQERVVNITRVSKVVKGGRRFGFRALVIVGDGAGRVGIGIGKAREVPLAIRKGSDRAKKSMVTVALAGNTIPHEALVKFGAAKVLLKPASPGTGVIAGGGVRAIVQVTGIRDILSKSMGSDNVCNVVMATFIALRDMKDVQVEAVKRGRNVVDLMPSWRLGHNG